MAGYYEAPEDGVYVVAVTLQLTATADLELELQLRVNGTTKRILDRRFLTLAAHSPQTLGGTCVLTLTALDQVEAHVKNLGGSSVSVDASAEATVMSVAKVAERQ